MPRSEPNWNQHLDRLAQHLLAAVTDEPFHFTIDKHNQALKVDDDHAIGNGLHHFKEAVILHRLHWAACS